MYYHVCLIEAELLKLNSAITKLKKSVSNSTLSVFKQNLKLAPSLPYPQEKEISMRVEFTFCLEGYTRSSCLPYHLSHHHFHQFLPAEDSIHTLRGHVDLAFQPWLEKAETIKSSHWHTRSSFSAPEVRFVIARNY